MAIRCLTKDEIETRVATMTKDKKSANVLLYKTARTDYDLLDEVFGAGNWQCEYREIKNVMYCGIGVLFGDKWVWKWNAGVESQGTGEDDSNNQKGEASDAIKRAGFCWGIGRELYKWKDLWVPLIDGDISDSGKCRARFEVGAIEYDAATEPTYLLLTDRKGNKRYEWGKSAKASKSPDSKREPQGASNVTPKEEKTHSAPKNDVKPGSVLTPEQIAAAQNEVKQNNIAAQKRIISEAYRILSRDYDQDRAVQESKKAMATYIVDTLRLDAKKIELVEIIDREPTLDDITPRIQGDVVLLIDEMFWNGTEKQLGFLPFVEQQLPFFDGPESEQ